MNTKKWGFKHSLNNLVPKYHKCYSDLFGVKSGHSAAVMPFCICLNNKI